MTKLWIEFPTRILAGYNGGLSNLDVTLDDSITWLIEKPFRIGFFLDSINEIEAVPGQNEAFFRYKVTIRDGVAPRCAQLIKDSLTAAGYERGCTIRSADGEVLSSDADTADIIERRRIKKESGRTRRRS